MKKRLLGMLIFTTIVFACNGPFWTGNPDYSGDILTISIQNPFFQGIESQQSRALALQGKYLYIELARIENQALYNTDTDKSLTGIGFWKETTWGGHAILTFDLTNWTLSLDAVFKDVPRDQDLKARVILETSESNFNSKWSVYDGVTTYPLCQTYNIDGSTYEDKSWVLLTTSDLQQNIINLPIRPVENGISFNSVFGPMDINMAQTDNYIDSGLAAYSNTEPQPGFTSLSNLSINMVTGEVDIVVHDIAFYLVVEASLTPGLPLPGIVQIYEKDGAPANSFTAGDTYSLTPEYPYKSFSVFYPELVNYDSSGLFFSSTIFQGPDLENGAVYNYASDYYNVSYGIAFDSTFSFAAYDLIFEWDLTPGLAFDDLDFKVVYIEGATLQDDEWDTVAEVNALNPTIHIDWADDCSIYYGTVSNPDGFYDITGSTMLSNLYAVILAKFPGGEEFIYAKQFSN